MRNENATFNQEADDRFILTKEKFVTLCVGKLQEKLPEDAVITKTDDMHYDVELSDDHKIGVYLGNVWSNYQRSGNYSVIEEFIDVQTELLTYMNKLNTKQLDMDQVFPVFRDVGFDVDKDGKMKEKNKDKGMIVDSFSDAFKILYVQDHPKFVSFLINDQLPDGVTEEELTDRAFENLKRQGWVAPHESIDIEDVATVHFFKNTGKQFQAQFMVREMYEPHLGDYFWFSLPTRDHAVVVAWHKNPDDHMEMGAHIAMTLKKQTIEMYERMQSPLSHVIHRVTEGDVKLLG